MGLFFFFFYSVSCSYLGFLLGTSSLRDSGEWNGLSWFPARGTRAQIAMYFPSREMETLGKERPCKGLMADKDMHSLGWKRRLGMEFPMSVCEVPTHWGLA